MIEPYRRERRWIELNFNEKVSQGVCCQEEVGGSQRAV